MVLNNKHEKFAQAIAAGKSQAEAYEEAGYKPSRSNASNLARDPAVVARVTALLRREREIEAVGTEVAIERSAITKELVLEELAKAGFANMLDYIQIGPDGLPYTDFSTITRDQAAAIGNVVVETTPGVKGDDGTVIRPEVKKVRFSLLDKLSSLEKLGKHLGLFNSTTKHTHEHTGQIKLDVSAREIIERRIAIIAARAATPEGTTKPE
jgi:phage terminase small subunit